jgi:antitoxin VapB
MAATAKLIMDGDSQVVLLPDEFRFEGTEVRVTKVGDKIILEPIGKKPFDAAAWRASLQEFRDIPFMEDGRDQGIGNSAPLEKQGLDPDAWFARLDELGARDFLPDGIPDEPPAEPDPRKFID